AFATRRDGREDRRLPLGVVAARHRPPPSSPPSPARGRGGGGEWWGATCRNAFPRRIPNITSTSWRSVSAPGRSLLLTTYTSAISITPALSVWMPSPDSGTSTSSVVSALRAISSSVWPTPTVSTRMRANPNASSRSATSSVVVARPPCPPRVRMAQHPLEAIALIFDEGDRAGQRRGLVPVECLEDALHVHAK